MIILSFKLTMIFAKNSARPHVTTLPTNCFTLYHEPLLPLELMSLQGFALNLLAASVRFYFAAFFQYKTNRANLFETIKSLLIDRLRLEFQLQCPSHWLHVS